MDYTRLIDILPYQLKANPKEACLASKVNGHWKKLSTQEVTQSVNQVSHAFINYGLQPGDKVALISNNRPEWNILDLGMLQAGLVNIPVYPTITEAEFQFIFNDAEVKLIFVSDENLFRKVSNIKMQVPSLQKIFTFDRVQNAHHWSEFLDLGKTPNEAELNARKAAITTTTLATIIYTSGTTGVPKGVMLSHDNIISNVKATVSVLPIDNSAVVLSFLPLCHIFERMVLYCYLAVGASVYYAESMETLVDNLKEVKPDFFTSVPRLLEKVYDKVVNKGLELTGVKKKLFFWALNLGLEYDLKGNNGFFYNIQLYIARKLIFSKWKEALGGNIKGIVTGAAALQVRLSRVFTAAGIDVRQGYGQTETSPVVTVDRFEPGQFLLGSVGQVIPSVQIKLDSREGMAEGEGEICVKGPNVMMGYYKREDLTAETIDKDGWLHTGDVGKLVDGKFLTITDRVKELFKTSGGKYVAPQVIENKLKESPLIEQLMVVGENQKFVGALIVPSVDNLRDFCSKNNVKFNSLSDAILHESVIKEFEKVIEEYNVNFNKVEQIKRFKLLPKEWTIDSGEMTPTLKIKRKIIAQKYSKEIEEIFSV